MKKIIPIIVLLSMAFVIILNPSCNKDEEETNTDDPIITDNVSPMIVINSPTADFSYLSTTNTITISGNASDDVSLDKVQWISSTGDNGTATGTEDWTAQDLSLITGDNLFKFIAIDAANNSDTATLLVTYNEFFAFSGGLNVNPGGFYVNANTDVKFQIPIQNNPNLVANSIKLIQVDQQGNILEELGEMFDDGDLAHGDDILGDGIYSSIHSFVEPSPVRLYMRVQVTTNEATGEVTSFSEINNISVVDQIPETTVQEITDIQLDADEKFQQVYASSGMEEAISQTIEYLEQQSQVTGVVQTLSGDIWIEFEYGLEGMILTGEEGDEGGSLRNDGERATSRTIPLAKQNRGMNSPALYQAKDDENIVLDKDVMLFAPNWTQFHEWGTEFLDNLNTTIENSECPNFNIDYLKNESADLDALRTLTEYGLIVIHTHGGLDSDNNVIFLTGDEVDYNFTEILDWALGYIMSIPHKGKTLWAVKPSFISNYNSNYPNTIVYNGSCESARNNTMSNAFLNKGANTYFGFSQTVKSWFDRDMANQLFPELITNGKTTGEAFVPNQHDNNNPPAYFVMRGSTETHFTSEFVNGDFEEGNLAGWGVIGDGRIITQLGNIAPYGGSFMGIISTGLGFTVQTGSLSQNFCVPIDATTLSLNWNFLSEEFLEWVGSQYQDYFQISIIDDAGIEDVIFYKTIDNINDQYGVYMVSPEIVFDQGDVYGTGWLFVSFDITAYAGEGVTLVLTSGDVGDSIYDTVILLDDITIQ